MIDNLTELKYFLEVAKTGNMTRASERLGVTQPSLTLAIQRLEEKAGVTLLERSRKGSHLTRQGSALLKAGERMLLDWERETRKIAQGEESPIGRYTIGLHSTVAQYTLDAFIPQLLNQYRELEFDFIHDLSRVVTEKLISRECDLALVVNPIEHPDLIMHKILTDEVTLFKHPSYKGDVLIYDPALKQSQALLKNIKKMFDYKRELKTPSLEVVRKLCESKAGVAVLPSRVAALSSHIKAVVNAPTLKDEVYLIYRMERKSEPSFKLIVQAIKAAFA